MLSPFNSEMVCINGCNLLLGCSIFLFQEGSSSGVHVSEEGSSLPLTIPSYSFDGDNKAGEGVDERKVSEMSKGESVLKKKMQKYNQDGRKLQLAFFVCLSKKPLLISFRILVMVLIYFMVLILSLL